MRFQEFKKNWQPLHMYEKYIKGLDSQENQLLYIQISMNKM